MKARLTFTSGAVVAGRYSSWFADDIEVWQWMFDYEKGITFWPPSNKFGTKDAALEDFKRFGEIVE